MPSGATYRIKRGDTSPALYAQLLQADSTPLDLTGASVKFIMRAPGAPSPKISQTSAIDDAANGKVHYQWVPGDTDTEGTFRAEFEATLAGGRVVTVPNDDYVQVFVLGDLG